jgi:hypothetical protein
MRTPSGSVLFVGCAQIAFQGLSDFILISLRQSARVYTFAVRA